MTRIHYRLQRLERARVVQSRKISIDDLRFQSTAASDRSRDAHWPKTAVKGLVHSHVEALRKFQEELKAPNTRL